MGVKAILLAITAMTLSGCSTWEHGYGYAYCYGPGGPYGYAYGPNEPRPACAAGPTGVAYYLGPYPDGYRGPYVAGPYYRAAGEPARPNALPTPAATR